MKYRKKIVSIAVSSLLCILVAVLSKGSVALISDSDGNEPSPEGTLAFSVLGDVHDDIPKFEKAVHDLYNIDPRMDVMILNGDVVDEGLRNQYDAVKEAIRKNRSFIPQIIIKNIGNHEFFDYSNGVNSEEDIQTFINRYLEFSGEKNVYHDTWVKGYHFISMGSEEDNRTGASSTRAYIGDKQRQWLKDILSEGYEKGKPIFVFLHQNLVNNKQGWTGVENGEEINKILSQYPEVILFTSHTHASLQNTPIKLNQPFTMVHTGAVHYTLEFDSNGGRKTVDDNQGIYVYVHDNKVEIKGRDFKSKSWVYSQEIKF